MYVQCCIYVCVHIHAYEHACVCMPDRVCGTLGMILLVDPTFSVHSKFNLYDPKSVIIPAVHMWCVFH